MDYNKKIFYLIAVFFLIALLFISIGLSLKKEVNKDYTKNLPSGTPEMLTVNKHEFLNGKLKTEIDNSVSLAPHEGYWIIASLLSPDKTKIAYAEINNDFKDIFLISDFETYYEDHLTNQSIERPVIKYNLYIKNLEDGEERLVNSHEINLENLTQNIVFQSIPIPTHWTKNSKKVILDCPIIYQNCFNDCYFGTHLGCEGNLINAETGNMESMDHDGQYLDNYLFVAYTQKGSDSKPVCNSGGGPWPSAHESHSQVFLENIETGEVIKIADYPNYAVEIGKSELEPDVLKIYKEKIGPIDEGYKDGVYLGEKKLDYCYSLQEFDEESMDLSKYFY